MSPPPPTATALTAHPACSLYTTRPSKRIDMGRLRKQPTSTDDNNESEARRLHVEGVFNLAQRVVRLSTDYIWFVTRRVWPFHPLRCWWPSRAYAEKMPFSSCKMLWCWYFCWWRCCGTCKLQERAQFILLQFGRDLVRGCCRRADSDCRESVRQQTVLLGCRLRI